MASLLLGRSVDDETADPVAIKVIHKHLSEDWQFVRMFVDEALISVRLRHPNVVRVDELGEQNDIYYLVMEYVHGCSLAQLLTSMAKRGRRMRPEIAVWIAQQIADGLHAAHEMTGHDGALLGVIHRDVSPQNVLISVDGSVKLLDFGIAKARGRAERTEAGVIKGKIRYMAPEQAMGSPIDRRIDVYALGVVLWEMLTMRRYIEGKNELEVLRKVQSPDHIPPGLRVDGIDPCIDEAVLAAIAPDPSGRPGTAADLHRALAAAVPEGTVGPAHVAELLRLFAAEAIEAAARDLPSDVAAIAARVRDVNTLPGDARSVDDGVREETLTRRGAPTELAAGEEEVTRGEIPAAMQAEERMRPEIAARPIAERADGDGDDEEKTVEASGPELSAFLARVRQDEERAREPAAPPAPARATPQPAPRVASVPPDPAPAPSPERSALSWALRVLAITVVAFALGAGLSILWLELTAG